MGAERRARVKKSGILRRQLSLQVTECVKSVVCAALAVGLGVAVFGVRPLYSQSPPAPAPPRLSAAERHLQEHPAAHLRRRERGGLFFAGRHSPHLSVDAPDYPCDQIYTMKIDGTRPHRVSTGTGRTTCGYFYPGGKQILFASTHEASARVPAEAQLRQRLRLADLSGLRHLSRQRGWIER